MHSLLTALGILRPVYWLLPERQHADGAPREQVAGFDDHDVVNLRDYGYGVFFCPNELGDKRNTKNNLRHDGNVIRFTSVFVDLDKGENQLERLHAFHLPPSAIVRTGRGHHAYWILDRFESVSAHDWKNVQKAMARKLEGDGACTDPARLMRLPDTWHVKSEPKLVEVLHFKPEWIYTLDQFPGCVVGSEADHDQAGQSSSVFALPPPNPGARRIIRPPQPPIIRVIEEGTRHATLVKECARYLRGVSPSEISERVDTLKAWYAQSSRPLKANWEHEVQDVCDWIIHRELGNY